MRGEQQARKVRAEYVKVARSRLASYAHGRAAGELLANARKMLGKKLAAWRRWLDEECGLPERAVLQCILLHRHWHEIEAAGDDPEEVCRKAAEVLRKRWPGPQGRPLKLERVKAEMTRFKITGDPARLLELITTLGFIP